MSDMRSKLMATESDRFDIPGMICGDVFAAATICESCYWAAEQKFSNEYVQLLIKDGAPGSLWDRRMPKDVVCWLTDEGNAYNDSLKLLTLKHLIFRRHFPKLLRDVEAQLEKEPVVQRAIEKNAARAAGNAAAKSGRAVDTTCCAAARCSRTAKSLQARSGTT